MTMKEYYEELKRAVFSNPIVCQLLRKKENALILARDFGFGLGPYDEKEVLNFIGETYGDLLVRATDLRPPIDCKDWVNAIKEGYYRYRRRKHFEYYINIENADTGKLWAVVEEFDHLPESFVSNKGEFLFKLKEDNKKAIDTWVLVKPHNKALLNKFLKRKLTYGELLKESELFIVYWDLNKDRIYLKEKTSLDRLVKLNKNINNLFKLRRC